MRHLAPSGFCTMTVRHERATMFAHVRSVLSTESSLHHDWPSRRIGSARHHFDDSGKMGMHCFLTIKNQNRSRRVLGTHDGVQR